jgi:hypothetical protein
MLVKNVSYKKLKSILESVNTNVIKQIKIKLSSSSSSDMPFWASVIIGQNEYEVMLGDIDERYWKDGIEIFFHIIKDSKIEYICEPYIQFTCSGKKIWSI